MHRHDPRGSNACNRPCNGPSSAFWRTSASRQGVAEHGIHWRHVFRSLPCDLPFVRPSQCLRGRGRIAAGNLLVHADPDPGLGARTHSSRRTRPALCLPGLRPNASASRSTPLSPSVLHAPKLHIRPPPTAQEPHPPSWVDRAPRRRMNADALHPSRPSPSETLRAGYSARPSPLAWVRWARHSGTNPAGKLHLCCTNRRRALGYAPLLSCPFGSPCPCASC